MAFPCAVQLTFAVGVKVHEKFSLAPTASVPVKPESTAVHVAQLPVPVTFTFVIATCPVFVSCTVIVTGVLAPTVVPGVTLTRLSVVAALQLTVIDAVAVSSVSFATPVPETVAVFDSVPQSAAVVVFCTVTEFDAPAANVA